MSLARHAWLREQTAADASEPEDGVDHVVAREIVARADDERGVRKPPCHAVLRSIETAARQLRDEVVRVRGAASSEMR